MATQSLPGDIPFSIANPFTQSWIQALTASANNPVARTIKPKLELVETLSHNRSDANPLEAAQELWTAAEQGGFSGLLKILPTSQKDWLFDRDDIFLYTRRDPPSAAEIDGWTFAAWTSAMGLVPGSFPLTAEVTSADWIRLVRNEAVRLRQTFDKGAFEQASTMHLPCTAHWDLKSWKVQFDQVDWIVVPYEDTPTMPRPGFETLHEQLEYVIANAGDTLISKKSGQAFVPTHPQAWFSSVPALQPLHELVASQAKSYSPWLLKTWYCVWPVVYRHHNVLKGQADLDEVRKEIKTCLNAQPQLTMWMFMFAKILCQTQTSMGLGVCADFV